MKTLGAGFHQKVEGIHSLSLVSEENIMYSRFLGTGREKKGKAFLKT